MANGHGGYRRPSNPAPASGPGPLARRTDGGPGQPVRELSDPRYGEQQAFREQQQAAPMGGGQGANPGGLGGMSGVPVDTSGIVPLDAPTAFPDEPVTEGADLGAGRGLEALGVNPQAQMMDPEFRERMRSYMPVLLTLASKPGTSKATRQFIRQLRGELL